LKLDLTKISNASRRSSHGLLSSNNSNPKKVKVTFKNFKDIEEEDDNESSSNIEFVHFNDEFLSKYNEFSESWRAQIQKEKSKGLYKSSTLPKGNGNK
jgi:hypothetical protein